MTAPVRRLTLGFIPLTDAAPLIVAAEKGFFAAEGLDVSLSREASWATVRDKVVTGVLDGAHMLAPMVLAATLAADFPAVPLIAPMSLNRGGAAVTVSNSLAEALGPGDPVAALRRVVAARRAAGEGALTFAVVFPFSIHNDLLRGWLADAAVTAGPDVRIVVIPPPRMAEQMDAGRIDGFCVGAPWNDHAVEQGIGVTILRAPRHWSGGSDKVLGLREAWACDNADAVQAILRALLRGAAWADDRVQRGSLAAMLAAPQYVGVAPATIAGALADEIAFHRDGVSIPHYRHAEAFIARMARWGQIAAPESPALIAERVYRVDLLRDAYAALDWPWPTDGDFAADTE